MKIVLASSNKGKIYEFKKLLPACEVLTYEEILGKMDIVEDGKSFKENAIIKAKTVYEKLQDKNIIVIADDSGISVGKLGNEPNIYSARYAKIGASDKENNDKLIFKLKEIKQNSSNAFYTACIAIAFKDEIYTVHGFMHGEVTTTPRGENGFGYDPLFIPHGFNQTLGELPDDVKEQFSHRSSALKLAKKVLDVILK